MANTPSPRSYNQILGAMINAFLAKFPIRNLKVGGPILSILEAGAQSDFRNTSDTFNLLSATTLDSAQGSALDRILEDEGTARLGSSPSTGVVTVNDTRYTKYSSVLYQGQPAPLAGSQTIYVTDATGWPATGQLYIGRNTSNYEGPLAYTAITPPAGAIPYWTITLNIANLTTKYHNVGESVIVAQGGDRTITAGSLVQTSQGNVSNAVQFSVLYSVILPDGEVSLTNVQVVCTQPGKIGNVPSQAIVGFASVPFTGATASNPLPFTNGTEAETDDEAKARLRMLRQSRQLGTATAIESSLAGVVAQDENKRIASAKVVTRAGYPTTVYVDDGTGYSEVFNGVAYEVLTASAVGGEQYFQLSLGRPVTKANVQTSTQEPWNVVNQSNLLVNVGGVPYQHTFTSSDFQNIANAAAYEVAHSINANPNIGFSARLSDNNSRVTIFAKNDTNEDVQVLAATSPDANTILKFSNDRADTIRLYKNDVLLSKDGLPATIQGYAQSSWLSMSTGETLTIAVDGTAAVTYTFTDGDFVNAATGYLALTQNNSLASWAAVINSKIPGVTATVSSNLLVLTSNAGAVTRGSLVISGGTLTTKGMFPVATSSARASDYTLDRNTGQIHLTSALVAGDVLAAGSARTRGFIESTSIAGTVLSVAGKYWFFVDGNPQFISVPFTSTTLFTTAVNAAGGRPDYLVLDAGGAAIFGNVAVGDYVILWDSTLSANKGAHRVIKVQSTSQLYLSGPAVAQAVPTALASGGITVVRTTACVQAISEPGANNYTAISLANFFNTAGLVGQHSASILTGKARLTTNTFASNGDISLAARDATLSNIPLPVGTVGHSGTAQLAHAESGNPDNDVPLFLQAMLASSGTVSTYTYVGATYPGHGDPGNIYTGLRNMPYNAGVDPAYGNHLNFVTPTTSVTTGANPVLNFRTSAELVFQLGSRLAEMKPYSIGGLDTLSVILDNDINSKRFDLRVSRKVDPSVGTYNTTFIARDADNGSLGFQRAFGDVGTSPFFNDYALWMHSRQITDAATTKQTLWRWKDMGRSGERVGLRYDYPLAPNQALTWAIDPFTTQKPILSILLPSGASVATPNITTTVKIGAPSFGQTGGATTPYRFYLLTGLQITQYQMTAGVVTLKVAWPAGLVGITNHGMTIGNSMYFNYAGGVPLTSMASTLTGTPDGTHIQYTVVPPPADVALSAVGAWGWIYFDGAPGADFTGLVAGDIISFSATSGVRSQLIGQGLYCEGIVAGFNNQAITVLAKSGAVADTTIPWPTTGLTSLANMSAYTVGATAASIVTAVNALTSIPVTAVGTGVGVVSDATWKSSNDITLAPLFLDGLNYVQAVTQPGGAGTDYQFQLKNAVSASLVAEANWGTEEVYLAPITAPTIASFLNTTATNGIPANGEVRTSSRNRKIQIATALQGSSGSVEIRGGTANAVTANVQGVAGLTLDSLSSYAVISATESNGFHAQWHARIKNTLPYLKVNAVSTANLTSIVGSTWLFGSAVGTYYTTANVPVQIEHQGRYTCLSWTGAAPNPNFGTIVPGDYLYISKAGGDTVSTNNQGSFIIIAIDTTNKVVWIDNPNSVDELTIASLQFGTRDSIWYGDKLTVGTNAWGIANQMVFTIASIVSSTSFTTSEVPAASGAVAGPQPLVHLNSGLLHEFVKQIRSIVPYPNSSTQNIVLFEDPYGYQAISSVYGSQLQAASKLEFTVGIGVGKDGYAYSAGLIGEANRVLYGNENDPITYPGVVAAGANINISGPIVRRVQVALTLRVRQGISKTTVFDAVRSAVAAYVNDQPVGQSIAISDIVAVANAVGGVDAVAVSSPTYTTSSDLISVQPYEKPMVLTPDTDITLTLAG